MFFRVEGAPANVDDGLYRLVVTRFPGDDKEVALENSLFDGMLSKSLSERGMGATPAGRELYVTLTGSELPEEVWNKIKNKTAAVYFMGRFRYSDARYVYHSDYCGFFMGNPPPSFLCHYHNAEP